MRAGSLLAPCPVCGADGLKLCRTWLLRRPIPQGHVDRRLREEPGTPPTCASGISRYDDEMADWDWVWIGDLSGFQVQGARLIHRCGWGEPRAQHGYLGNLVEQAQRHRADGCA